MATQSEPLPELAKRARLSQTDVPSMELEKALRLATTIWDQFAGKPTRPLQLAGALEIKPSSGGWRELTGASIAYGLTEGGYNAQDIKLTDLGRRAVAPKDEGDDTFARAEAALAPRVCRDFFTKYEGAKFPLEKNAVSVLVDLGVPKERTEKVVSILRSNGSFVGFLHTIKSEIYVSLHPVKQDEDTLPPSTDDGNDDAPITNINELGSAQDKIKAPEVPVISGPKKIFVAHGKQRDALDAVKRVLDRFKVPYVVAVDEPHAGRPISSKVATLMRECSAGIFIFTPDEHLLDEKGADVYRPSENVVFELGAGNILWDQKIVILKESTVNFASDYRDIGYIEFSMENPRSIGTDLLTELIGLDFLKIQVAS